MTADSAHRFFSINISIELIGTHTAIYIKVYTIFNSNGFLPLISTATFLSNDEKLIFAFFCVIVTTYYYYY